MAQTSIAAHVEAAWSKARSGWRGEAADVFRGEYMLRLQERGGQLDRACGTAAEQTQLLMSKLAALESKINA